MVSFPNVKAGDVLIDSVSVPRRRLRVRVVSVDHENKTAEVSIDDAPARTVPARYFAHLQREAPAGVKKQEAPPAPVIRAGTHAAAVAEKMEDKDEA